jgi:hypothetical protein
MGKTRRLYRGGKPPKPPKPPKAAAPAAAPKAAAPKAAAQPQQQGTRKKGQTPDEKAQRAAEAKAKGLEAQRKKAQESGQSLEQRQANIAKKKKKDQDDAEAAKKAKKKRDDDEKAAAAKRKKADDAKKKGQQSQAARPASGSFAPPSMPSAPGSGFGNMGAAAAAPAAAAAAAAAPAAAADAANSSGSSYGSTSDGPYSPEEAAAADTIDAGEYGLNPDGSINCDSSPPGECPSEEQCLNQALYFMARSNAVADYRRQALATLKSLLETLQAENIVMKDYIQANPTIFPGMLVAAPVGGDGDKEATPRVFNNIKEVDDALEGAVKEIIQKNKEQCLPKVSTQSTQSTQSAGRRTRRRRYGRLRKTQHKRRSHR